LHRLEENVGAASVELTAGDHLDIDSALSNIPVQGARYPEHLQRRVGRSAENRSGVPVRYLRAEEKERAMAQGIKDKVVVITGASSGLGEATARRLARDGAKLVLGARRIERLQALAKELSLGDSAAVETDVTRYEQVTRLVDRAVQSHGRIDVIINNAGLMPHSPLERGKVEDWDRMIDVNIKGVLYGIAAALPHMKVQKSGHIINVSSVAGHLVRPGGAVYSATKHAVRVISEGLRQEVKPYNIRTTIISPGAVATELPDSVTEADVAEGIRQFYDQFAVPADSFAGMVAFAMSQPEDVDINEILYRPTRQEL
jgi:NADP-dependent 3-hydroxy acid dehydrogenase YdfG